MGLGLIASYSNVFVDVLAMRSCGSSRVRPYFPAAQDTNTGRAAPAWKPTNILLEIVWDRFDGLPKGPQRFLE